MQNKLTQLYFYWHKGFIWVFQTLANILCIDYTHQSLFCFLLESVNPICSSSGGQETFNKCWQQSVCQPAPTAEMLWKLLKAETFLRLQETASGVSFAFLLSIVFMGLSRFRSPIGISLDQKSERTPGIQDGSYICTGSSKHHLYN